LGLRRLVFSVESRQFSKFERLKRLFFHRQNDKDRFQQVILRSEGRAAAEATKNLPLSAKKRPA
jgi:hypothetical protein